MTTTLDHQALLTKLVSFDTTSCNSNLPLADFICDYLERPGIRIERHPNEDDSKVNLLIMAGPEPPPESRPEQGDDSGLILSGHMDVVPATEPEWTTDPFALTERDGSLYGRGSCDMKGFDALAVNALANVDVNTLTRPLGILLTYDEELGTLGAQYFARHWPKDRRLPKNALIGEPTSLKAVRMHKGHLSLRITIRGTSAHSGSPHLGVNAIEPAGDLITTLIELQKQFGKVRLESSQHFPDVPYPVLSVTTIRGGSAINIVPDVCVLEVSIRLLPGQRGSEVIPGVRSAIEQTLAGREHAIEQLNESPPMLLSEDANVYRELCGIIGQTETYGETYASDAGPFQDGLGMECVLYGPGTISVAHKPNEFLPIDEFMKAAEVVEKLIQRLCMA
ncbi:MAG: acetylornithine deacetylase [Planctomycetes bacterium]|nr:acetylornithine deacetylase [Planctomycetota bacterium]